MTKDPARALRDAEIRVELDREYAARGITATNRRDWLLNGLDHSPAARSYVIGADDRFDVREIADQIAASDYGAIAIKYEEDDKRSADRSAQLAMISTLPPAQRINAARRLGLD